MPYAIRVEGLDRAQALLGVRIEPALQAATKAIALEVQNVIAPYPPATTANDSSQDRWYERGYGPRWRVKSGEIHGSKTSQMLNRSWGIRRQGAWGSVLGSRATYAPYLHDQEKQARWAARIGWVTDSRAVSQVVASGVVKRIVTRALVAAMRRRG